MFLNCPLTFTLVFTGLTERSEAIPKSLDNASERGIIKLKIKLKNSDCFRLDIGADAFMDPHSIVETTKKHGNSPYNAILALF